MRTTDELEQVSLRIKAAVSLGLRRRPLAVCLALYCLGVSTMSCFSGSVHVAVGYAAACSTAGVNPYTVSINGHESPPQSPMCYNRTGGSFFQTWNAEADYTATFQVWPAYIGNTYFPPQGFCAEPLFAVSTTNGCVQLYMVGYSDWRGANSYQLTARFEYQKILFKWDDTTVDSSGGAVLIADGSSAIHGSASSAISGSITWTSSDPSLCTVSGDNSHVTVKSAGTNTGTVTIRATDGSGACYEKDVDVVDPKCNGCQGCPITVQQGSVDVRIDLGWALRGNTAQYLQIKADRPSTVLATPQALLYSFKRPEVEVYTNSLGMRQVKSPSVLANVVTNSSTKYFIQLYAPTNIVGVDVVNGGYLVTNSPYRTLTVESVGGDTNHMRFTDSSGDLASDYTWQTNGWNLATGGGLRNELKTTDYSQSNTVRTVTTTIRDTTNAVLQTKIEIYTADSYGERLTTEIVGAGQAARTNTYSYTTNGFLQQSVRWDGSWEYYVYDSNDRPTNVFSTYLNQGVTTNRALCRLIEYDYSPGVVSGSGDSGSNYFHTPRRTIEYVQGAEVSRKYFVGLATERREIVCVNPGDAWNSANNLVTTNKLFASGFHVNEPQTVIHPDGTADIYQYSSIGRAITNTVISGHLDASGTNIDAGTRTISIQNLRGQLTVRTAIDIASGITTANEIYSYDAEGHLTNTVYLDGTSAQATYNCCGMDSRTDRDGTVTSYTYDVLKRLSTTTVNSGTSSNRYDAAGNVLGTFRISSGGQAITTGLTTYDDAGDVLSAVNALGQTTTYTNYFDGSGQLVKVTTNPDTSTRIETYFVDGSLKSVTGTAVMPVRYEYGAEDNNGVTNAYTKEIKLNTNGTDTGEWVKTYTDGAGRTCWTVYADNNSSRSFYNNAGQLSKQVDPDGVTTLYQYNNKGELEYTAVDVNTNGVIDFGGSDRITRTVRDVLNDGGVNVQRSRTYLWQTDNSSASNLISTATTSVDGLRSWNIVWNGGTGLTNSSQTIYVPASGYRITVNATPDGSTTITTNQYGRPVSVTRRDALNNQLAAVSYGYDAHGRQNTMTDARNGTTTYYFNNADQISGVLTPSPDGVAVGQTTTNYFDVMGRVWKTTLPDNTSVTNEYFLTGQLQKTYGSRTYPVEYTYDYAGRMQTMKTWTNFTGNAGAAVTTWNYDSPHGFLTNKVYEGNQAGPGYTYTAAGRLQTRTWARGITTTYAYNPAGDLTGVDYSDSTADVAYGYDRRGLKTTVTNGMTVCAFGYSSLGLILTESYTGGPLDGITVTNGYDTLLHRTDLAISYQLSTINSARYGYDPASRLQTVTSGNNSASYSYLANSPLVGQISFTNYNVRRMAIVKQYDHLNRLTGIVSTSTASGQTPFSFSYPYNDANQRTAVTNADSSYWQYQYDSLGQVTSGKKYWADGASVAGQQFEYGFDDIGNRQFARSGGDTNGANLRQSDYSANRLNQYTSRTVPGYASIIGDATNTATVTVNEQATDRKSRYYNSELSLDNSASPVYLSVTNTATNGVLATNITGNLLIPQTPEAFIYDADGNMTSDGLWTNTWNAENRWIVAESLSTVPASARKRLEFAYDYYGRRVQKIVSTWNGSAYVPQSTNQFVYDGWNLVAILNSQSAIVQSLVWGLDLSGSMQGAGGVGGLLMVNDVTNGSHFVAFDGNGNVAGLVSAADGNETLRSEYEPFGKLLRQTGKMARTFLVGFSTKYCDLETEALYYGYRSYNPNMGKWLSRDPIGEAVTRNLYRFVDNDGINYFDLDGLEKGAEALVRMTRNGPSAFGDTPINPLNGLQLLVGLPFAVLSGDIFTANQQTQVKPGNCDVLITVNGVWNNKQARQALNDSVRTSPRYQGAQPELGVNPTTYVGDLLQIVGDELGAIQTSSFRLARQINSVYDQFKKNGCCSGKIQVFAHSQGTMVFRRALSLIKPEARKLIYYTGIGGETTIQGNYGLAGPPENYANYTDLFNRDLVPVIGNYNPLRIPTWPVVGLPSWTPTTPPTANWIEHTYDPYYKNFVNGLQPNGSGVPLDLK